MRVTESSIASSFLYNINETNERITQEQTELATGKAVNKVSDNPQATGTILQLKSLISNNTQYQQNTTEAQSQAQATESAMNSFTNVMISLKGILAQATNGTLSSEDQQTYADQVDQLLGQAVDLANTQSNGVYIFGGTNTLQQPFTLAADDSSVTANPNGITGSIQVPVNEGINQTVNLDGQQAFQGTAIFNLMIQVRDALQSGQSPTTAQATSVDTYIDDVANATGKAGAIMQNLTANSTMLSNQQTQLQQLLSVQQDSDVAAVTLKMNQDQLDLQAALSSGASVLPATLLNFLGKT